MSSIISNPGLLKILFLITLLLQIAVMFIEGNSIIYFVSRVVTVFWFWVLFKNSSIRKTFYFKIMLFFLALLMIGLLFKLEHLPGGSTLITTSVLGLSITYLLRTFKKKERLLLDWLKLSWVIAISIISLGIMEHFIHREYALLSNVLLLTIIGVFCFNPERYQNTGLTSPVEQRKL